MSFDQRLGWLLLGCAIGFVLGYIVRSLREIKEELDEVDELVKERRWSVRKPDTGLRRRKDDGFSRFPIVADIALLLVVALTVWAAVASQNAVNDSKDAQVKTSVISVCNQEFLAKTLKALNDRTVYTQAQLVSNVNVQKDQAAFFKLILEQPPRTEKVRRTAAEKYLQSLNAFVEISQKNSATIATNPFPEIVDLARCLDPQKYPSTKETPNE